MLGFFSWKFHRVVANTHTPVLKEPSEEPPKTQEHLPGVGGMFVLERGKVPDLAQCKGEWERIE